MQKAWAFFSKTEKVIKKITGEFSTVGDVLVLRDRGRLRNRAIGERNRHRAQGRQPT